MFKKIVLGFSLSLLSLGAFAQDYASKFVNTHVCDQVIDKGFYKTCYSYKMKGALATSYKLQGALVNKLNIKKRDRWYPDMQIPAQYRSYPSDYSHSGWDKGHSANDADFDFSATSLRAVYAISNATPQSPNCNRHYWVKAEKYERLVATKLGTVNVVNVMRYSMNPRRIGKHQIAVPAIYYKILYNDEKGFERCFAYKNSQKRVSGDKLKNHVVACGDIKSTTPG